MGSACTPCVRPICGVSLNSQARRSRISAKRSRPPAMCPEASRNEERLRGVDNVIGSETVVQPARRSGIVHGFTDGDGEGDNVVAHARFDFEDVRNVDAGTLANASCSFARDDTGLRKNVCRRQLDIQPLLESVFVAPDAAHLRTRVPWYQRRSPASPQPSSMPSAGPDESKMKRGKSLRHDNRSRVPAENRKRGRNRLHEI